MSDIAMCIGADCKVHESCYRFMAPINDVYQSWGKFPGTQGKPCIYFIEYKPSGTSGTASQVKSMSGQ